MDDQNHNRNENENHQNIIHHHHYNHLMSSSPRISFSNDFVDAQQAMRQEITRSSMLTSSSSSSDFEFSKTNFSMMTADELFFKGTILPNFNTNVKTTPSRPVVTTTLRDELLQRVEDDVTSRPRPSKGSSWKSLLGLKRAHTSASKKPDGRTIPLHQAHVSKTSHQVTALKLSYIYLKLNKGAHIMILILNEY